jgi:hypothetical protein
MIQIPKIEKIALDSTCREVNISSQPMGELMHVWAVELVRIDEPSIKDMLKAARGEWLYRIERFSISLKNPPVEMRMSIHTHHMLHNVRRGYLYPSDFPVKFRESGFSEGAYHATLENYYYQVAVATLPGDRVYIKLYSRQPFEGQLRILSC